MINILANFFLAATEGLSEWIISILPILNLISRFMGFVGVVVLVWGVLVAVKMLLCMEVEHLKGRKTQKNRNKLRIVLGFYLLLGLEFLVASDIIKTIATPSLKAVGILAAIVGVRTIISFTLNWEISNEQKLIMMSKKETL